MTVLRLKYVDEFRDRHGVMRYYFRRPGGKRTPLIGAPGSEEFRLSYEAAEAGDEPAKAKAARFAPGSMNALIVSYYAGRDFARLRASTKKKVRGVLERLAARKHKSGKPYGELQFAQMQRPHVEALLSLQAGTPGAANETLKCLRVLIRHAIMMGWMVNDPTLKMRKERGGSWRSWSDEEIAQFERRWPVGTRERLAFSLHLYTGQRRSDVVTMTWRDIAGERIHVVQEKTGEKLWIRLHRDLRAILSVAPREHVSIIIANGQPFSVAGYGNWMRDTIRAAGLPEECVTHGLRKAAGRRLAEAGCSARQIMAVLGHRTLSEAERYTKDADQRRLADGAIEALEDEKGNNRSQTFGPKFPTREKGEQNQR